MKLLFDLGNSRCKWCLWQNGEAHAHGAAAYTADGGLPEALFAALERRSEPVDTVVVCTVSAPRVVDDLEAWARRCHGLPIRRFTSRASHGGIVNAYPDPSSLGADRWAAIIGARSRYSGALCIVDCGTAVTVDVLGHDDRHAGGLIFPGLGLARRALSSGAHQLGEAGQGELPLLATDTPTAIRAGTFHALAHGIQGVKRQMEQGGVTPLTGVITGGDADVLAGVLEDDWRVDHQLVFAGMAREEGAA
ncbi:type III pantothenate kinase [Aquisalimonas asiatica]|uniref:Type III pantothenate kinase n=1 Tax=Aquisalimonas asiatica TaxID=406100 RepID=A0A1H8U072_9GAMM|nr:type III pantothenate kinase [Aquisalimonas asiatica]SEO96213.1 type III pantothenate kinase [Aquisalimonas asiatica]